VVGRVGVYKGDGGREHDAISEGCCKELASHVTQTAGRHCVNAKYPSEAVGASYEAFYCIID